jgi:hypothetical protein
MLGPSQGNRLGRILWNDLSNGKLTWHFELGMSGVSISQSNRKPRRICGDNIKMDFKEIVYI